MGGGEQKDPRRSRGPFLLPVAQPELTLTSRGSARAGVGYGRMESAVIDIEHTVWTAEFQPDSGATAVEILVGSGADGVRG